MATLARSVAILIAVLAVIDPATARARRDRPLVSVLAADSSGGDLQSRVERQLRRDFTIVGPSSSADAAVIVGRRVPDASGLPARVFAVSPDAATPRIVLEVVDIPALAQPQALARVRVRARLMHLASAPVTVSLTSDGAELDRLEVVPASDATVLDTSLAFLPTGGTMPLAVRAWSTGSVADHSTGATIVRDRPWQVLFHDPRPSWMSTFVRRVIEPDPRFSVATRIGTSRGIATAMGVPPRSLTEPGALDAFDVVVVGAPQVLSPPEVRGLESYLRERGGSVVFLLDDSTAGPHDVLLRGREWRSMRTAAASLIAGSGVAGTLRASAIVWPRELPTGGQVIAASDTVGGPAGRPIVWSAPVGGGRLWVSGALDAWHFRAPDQSGFGAFWLETIAEASASSVPAIGVSFGRSAVGTGEATTATIESRALANRDPSRAGGRLDASAMLVLGSDSVPVQLWPDATPGRMTAVIRGSDRPGPWRLVVRTDRGTTEAPLMVTAATTPQVGDEAGLVSATATARGGTTVSAANLADLPRLLQASLDPAVRVEQWHPMRSPWWIVAFGLLLGVEWWWRRRRGLA